MQKPFYQTLHRHIPLLAGAVLYLFSGCDESQPTAPVTEPLPEPVCPFVDMVPDSDPDNPLYEVVSPNGGGHYQVGDTLTVVTRSEFMGEGELYLVIGRYRYGLSEGSFFTGSEPDTHRVMLPASFEVADPGNPGTNRTKPTITDSALIMIVDYDAAEWFDYSDCYFSVSQ